TSLLTYTGAALGSGSSGATLLSNTSLINSGKLGLSVALPPGATFAPGIQQVVQVSFVAAVLSGGQDPRPTTISFGDQPTARHLFGTQINSLAATYSSGTVSIAVATNFEADVFPRANGDLSIDLGDWLTMGRYVARLDY